MVQKKRVQKKRVQKKFANLIFLVCMAYFCGIGTANAKGFAVVVKLDSIELKEPSEKRGNAFYIGVTQYSSLGLSKTDRIPTVPAYWESQQLPLIQNVTLWQGEVKEDEEVKVIFSLVRKDRPEDLIGSAQLVLTNQTDHLNQQWEVPVFEERLKKVDLEVEKSGNTQRFLMKDDKSDSILILQFHVAEESSL